MRQVKSPKDWLLCQYWTSGGDGESLEGPMGPFRSSICAWKTVSCHPWLWGGLSCHQPPSPLSRDLRLYIINSEHLGPSHGLKTAADEAGVSFRPGRECGDKNTCLN